jgi:signal transduction histidine kinase/tetratricopeptide (TPR) repeat protein
MVFVRKIFVFAFILLLSNLLGKSQVYGNADSLKLELEKPYHDTIKFELLLTIGDIFEYSQPEIAMEYYKQAKELTEKNLEQPSPYQRKFLQQKAKAIRYIAYVYQNQGDLNTALEKYFQALSIGESINCNLNIYNSYNNIGIISHIQKEYEVAREYYNKAIEITEKTGNQVGRAKLYINMGILNFELGTANDNVRIKQDYFREALNNYSNALKIKIEYNDIKGQSLCYENLGNLNKEMAKITKNTKTQIDLLLKAKQQYWKAIELSNKINDKMGLSKAYANLSELYSVLYSLKSNSNINRNVFSDSAVYYGTRSYQYAVEVNSTYLQNKAALLVKKSYTAIGDERKALEYADYYIESQEKLFSEDKTKIINEMRIKYETEKKDNEIKLLNQEKKINEIRIKNAKRERFFYIIIAITLFVLSMLLYRLNSNRRRSNEVLEEKNEELKILNSTKDKFISILAHDLKNPFSAFLNITNALSIDFDDIDNEDKKKLIDQLNRSAQQLNNLLKNMLEWAVIQLKDTLISKEDLNLNEIAEDVKKMLANFITEKNAIIQNSIPSGLIVSTNRSYLVAIFNNLITNAIKFSQGKNPIDISAKASNGQVIVSVEDKGIGIAPDDIEKLFKMDIDTQTIGKPEGKGTGMGLILCKEFIKKLNGDIWVESTLGEGSFFNFSLPLNS